MIPQADIREFVSVFYAGRDMMHNLTRVDRVLVQVNRMVKNHDCDEGILLCATYFHGLLDRHKDAVLAFLKSHNLTEEQIEHILLCAEESDKRVRPVTIEGEILHDAYLLEGGETFGIIRPMITGTLLGQTLEETIDFYEKHLQGQFKCVLPENFEAYQKREAFAYKVLEDLVKNI